MSRLSSFIHNLERESVLGLCIFLAWFAGLSLGFCAVRFYGDTFVLLISQAMRTQSSLMLPFITVFPLLLSAFAALILPAAVQYMLCFFRGAMMALVMGALSRVFPGGAVLASVLLLFSGLAFTPALLWFGWRRLCLGRPQALRDAFRCAAAGVLIAVVDLWVITPFLADVVML